MREMKDGIGDTSLLDPRDTESIKPLEEVALISIHSHHPDHHVMIGIELAKELRDALVEFLKRTFDVFAWSQGDVLGIYPCVTINKLFANLDHPPIH